MRCLVPVLMFVVVPATAAAQQPTGNIVHLDATHKNATIEALTTTPPNGEVWTPVCGAPCDKALDPNLEYRIGGNGLAETESFRLPRSGQLMLSADMATARRTTKGIIFTSIGGALAVLGGLSIGMFFVTKDNNNGYVPNLIPAVVLIGGVVLLGTAIALTIPGIYFLRARVVSLALDGYRF